MPTIIDALVVTLGLDSAKYNQGQKESAVALDKTRKAAAATSKDMQAGAKKISDSIIKVRNELLTLFAVFAGGVGLKDFISGNIQSASSLGLLSTNLDMSAKRLKAWQQANELAGGTQTGIVAQLQNSQGQAARFQQGQYGDDLAAFGRYNSLSGGFNLDKLRGTAEENLLEKSRLIKNILEAQGGGIGKAQQAATDFGISADTFNLIKQGTTAVQGQVTEREKSIHTTKEQTAAARELQKSWDRLKDTWDDVGTQTLSALTPLFDFLLEKLNQLALWIQGHQNEITAWASRAVTGIKEFATSADSAVKSVGGWKVVFEALLALKVASWAASLLGLGGALAGIGKGLTTIGTAGRIALPVLSALAPIAAAVAAPAAAAAALAYTLNKVAPNHRAGDIDPRTGKTWVTGGRGGGHWTDSAPGTTRMELVRPAKGAAYKQWSKVAPTAPAAVASSPLAYNSPELDAYATDVEKQYGLPAGVLNRLKNQGERTPIDPKTGTYAESSAHAKGVMQFTAKTWSRYGKGDINDPLHSIDAAGAYMADLLKQYGGNEVAAVAAYNGGTRQGNRVQAGAIPSLDETRNYVARVEGNRAPDVGAGAGGGNTSINETHIGTITISTRAVDAKGIARDIGPEIKRINFAANGNTGLN